MEKKKLKTAVIGAGGFGRWFHLAHITNHPGFELAAIVDVNEALLAQLHEEYRVPVYTDLSQMLAEVKPDLCSIASPTALHVAQTIACMEAGCDMIITNGSQPTNLYAIIDGESVGTLFYGERV